MPKYTGLEIGLKYDRKDSEEDNSGILNELLSNEKHIHLDLSDCPHGHEGRLYLKDTIRINLDRQSKISINGPVSLEFFNPHTSPTYPSVQLIRIPGNLTQFALRDVQLGTTQSGVYIENGSSGILIENLFIRSFGSSYGEEVLQYEDD